MSRPVAPGATPAIPAPVDELLRRLWDAGREPLFAFVNLMEVHTPYNPPRPFYPFPPWRRLRTFRLTGGPDQSLSYNLRTASR